MDKRLFALVMAGAVIAGLCLFKILKTYTPQSAPATPASVGPAPRFELYDQSSPSATVRLEPYLSRQRILVIFFDGKAGAQQSDALKRVRELLSRLRKAGVQVMAISTALPQENRRVAAAHGAFPFPLLSDPGLEVHEAWGRIDSKTHKPLAGVFLVDRKGLVAWSTVSNKPMPTEDWKSLVDNLAEEGR